MSQVRNANILIVDDKESNIFALEQLLQKPGRNFIRTTNANEALIVLLNDEIDLILLDVNMPGMDGFEMANILKSNNRTKNIPIVFVTAEMKDHKFILKGFEEGAVDYLTKPLDKEITEAKVSILLKLHFQAKELKEKNKALEKFFLQINSSADLFCIINPETLRFEEVNNVVTSLLGYPVQEIIGASVLNYIPEDDQQKMKKIQKKTEGIFSFETQFYCKKSVIKWLQWKIVSKNNTWYTVARDITEVRKVQDIKNYLATVVKQSNEAIYLHNPEGEIISWNNGAERVYGFSENEALKMKIWNIIPDHLMKETQIIINNILKGEEIHSWETKRITKYGKIIDVEFSASVIFDSNKALKSVAITERDITQQKKSELEIKQLNADLTKNNDQLTAINKELESFSYSVSHDLRTPLRAINGFANIIREDYGDMMDNELQRLLGMILSNSVKMGTLIDDLLAFSRLGRKKVEKKIINTNEMVHQVLDEMDNEMKGNAILQIGNLLPVQGDSTLIHQVFVNLISNALKYSSKKQEPMVEVNSFGQEDEHVFYVKDNGAGFNEAYIHKLFGVFQRLHSHEEFEGNGVGLAIVQRIIAKHGGRVWAEGEINKGAVFYFSLPKPVHPLYETG